MENKHFYWLKALRQKYTYRELIIALKDINQQLKPIVNKCEFKNLNIQCRRKTKKFYEFKNCCLYEEKCVHYLCWQHKELNIIMNKKNIFHRLDSVREGCCFNNDGDCELKCKCYTLREYGLRGRCVYPHTKKI